MRRVHPTSLIGLHPNADSLSRGSWTTTPHPSFVESWLIVMFDSHYMKQLGHMSMGSLSFVHVFLTLFTNWTHSIPFVCALLHLLNFPGIAPQPFQVVKFAFILVEDVDDHISEVHQYPACLGKPFDSPERNLCLLHLFLDRSHNGLHLLL